MTIEPYDPAISFDIEDVGLVLELVVDLMRPTTQKRGRPRGTLNAKSIAIRDAVLDLTTRFDRMTVRGVYYQLETSRVVPKSAGGYRSVQQQVLKMRRDDLLDWDFIADGTRWVRRPVTFDSAEDALNHTIQTYRQNLWRSQNIRIEIWLEKDTLADLIYPTTSKWQIPLMVSRGQTGDAYVHAAAMEARKAYKAGITTHIFTLYDSDSYGRSAAEKIEEKINTYSGVPCECELLAVTDHQVALWDLPTRPDKKEDREVVELDAIPPDKLIALVENAIVGLIDGDAWRIEQEYEKSERVVLERMVASA